MIHVPATATCLRARDIWDAHEEYARLLTHAGVAPGDLILSAAGNHHEAIGVLLAVRAIDAALLSVDAGTAQFVALGDLDLANAPGSLDALSAVGIRGDELAHLRAETVGAILLWVQDGGHLLVDSGAGTAIAGVPAEWQPGPAMRAPAGRGEVVRTDDAMTAGRWSGLVDPSDVATRAPTSMISDAMPDGFIAII